MRENWDRYFLRVAQAVSTRSTCPRRAVGALFVRERTILSTGYNGAISGMPHCTELGHDVDDKGHEKSCSRSIHAEQNAIIQAAKNGVRLKGSMLYTTTCPCWNCFSSIVNLGCKKIIYIE